MVIQMYIYGSTFTHNTFDCHEVFIHPAQVLLLIPDIPIHFFFKRLEILNIQILFGLSDCFRNLWILADIHFFRIIRSAGKGRVDVHQVNLNALLFEVGTGRNAFAPDNHIAVRIFTYCFLLFHLV